MKKSNVVLTLIFLSASFIPMAHAQESAPSTDLQSLKQQITEQQREIEQLRSALEAQQKLIQSVAAQADSAASTATAARVPQLGAVASTAPIIPPAPLTAPAAIAPAQAAMATGEPAEVPPTLHIGTAYITPVGFMDMTSVTRSENTGTGIGTNFGSVPYGNTLAGSLTESRLSIQNSRIGARVDALVKGWKVLGYWESDFLGQIGTSANSPNGGLAVSSSPYVFRLRLFYADVQKNKFEFLAGQSWSMMTPNRKGISPIPGDIFYTNDIDVNYQAGLVWARQGAFRFVFHPSSKVTFGLALENSEPYVGGGNGGGAVVLPAAVSSESGAQINAGNSGITAPAVHPDIIAKLAFDPSAKFHFELAGVEITNKVALSASPFPSNTKAGFGGSVNLNFELIKNVRLVTNNFFSDGAGRYIFGQAPDFLVRGDGSLSMIHSYSTVSGIEATMGKSKPTLVYVYYGGVYIQRNTALDANGTTLIGYGFTGSSSGQNRTEQEITFGTNTTFWKDGRYGALNLMFQYSYLQRNPWFVAAAAPTDAHIHMGFVNLRYTLPGSAPSLK